MNDPDEAARQRRLGYSILDAATRSLAEAHPGLPMGELIELLDEPDRTRARVIYQALAPDGLWLERVDRQWWHASVEQAISRRIRDDEFDLNDILAEADVAPGARERPEAEVYANRILDTLNVCPGQPVMPSSDRLQ